MSSTAALGLVVASFFAGYSCYIWTSKWSHEMAKDIATGTMNGVPISVRSRWTALYQRWIYLVAAAVGCTVVTSAVNFSIADLAEDGSPKRVALLLAYMSALVATSLLLAGVAEFFHLRTILRQAERD